MFLGRGFNSRHLHHFILYPCRVADRFIIVRPRPFFSARHKRKCFDREGAVGSAPNPTCPRVDFYNAVTRHRAGNVQIRRSSPRRLLSCDDMKQALRKSCPPDCHKFMHAGGPGGAGALPTGSPRIVAKERPPLVQCPARLVCRTGTAPNRSPWRSQPPAKVRVAPEVHGVIRVGMGWKPGIDAGKLRTYVICTLSPVRFDVIIRTSI